MVTTKKKPRPSQKGQRSQQHKLYSENTIYSPDVQGDNLEQFKEEMCKAGLNPPSVIVPGTTYRFPGVDKERGNTSGWCILFEDGTGGCYGDWSTNLKGHWQAQKSEPISNAERFVYKAKVKQAQRKAEADRKKQQDEAASRAAQIWDSAQEAPAGHDYLIKKKVKAHGLRVYRESLVVPLRCGDNLFSLQFIEPDGSKKFLSGGKTKGCYYAIGSPNGAEALCVCEGFATGATIHEVTSYPVAVAFNAGNLKEVSAILHAQFPDLSIIICADDDWKTADNPGISKAKEAAEAIGGRVAIPNFGPNRPEKATDFNDMAESEEAENVGSIITQPPPLVETKEWPKPLPLTAPQQAVEYPLDALPKRICAAVREVVEFVQCPVALGACSALAVVSTVAQGLADVRRADKLEGPTSLYLLAIADSGERKTTVDSFFSKPVQQWEAEQAEAAKPALKDFEAEKGIWETKQSGLLSALKAHTKNGKNTSELENKIADHETAKPKPPQVPRLLFGDTTPEALAYRLSNDWPVGGVLTSEAGMVFGGHAMSKDSSMRNMAMLNSLWGAEPLTVDRRSTQSFTVRSARLTMGLAVQSETVRCFLDSSKGLARGIGWLARFLIAWPKSTQGNRLFNEPKEAWPNLTIFHMRLAELLDISLPRNDMGELEPQLLKLSTEAKAAWVTFHNDIEAELRPGRDMAETRDVASKAADNAGRLAALFHIFENVTGDTIGIDHMRAAACLATWHLYEAKRFMGEIALSHEVNNAVKLDEWLLGHCQQREMMEVPTTYILQLGPSATRKKAALDAALEELEEGGSRLATTDLLLPFISICHITFSDRPCYNSSFK